MTVLVDTSVWVAHFRAPQDGLIDLLATDQVLVHPMVLGEIACGTPPDRRRTLQDLGSLQSPHQATLAEVIAFTEREELFGRGCGLIDLMLLSSTLMTAGASLWTLDRRLAALAERFQVLHRPALH
ncbi:VapC toxin family PIN domain ribonuclease [Xylophilus rhododendri]|uniref:VapC toxin family PIN domain ribonuclease n=1 Tax=Xylophilus rhododendri TaxID=2697032 RepID=A0A857JCM3_9BURK|nr:PIN domain-containing protein [Xylophilus rhododendri]QHJ00942.1 VapC toxin family PIN domain ribonuclease [Xylophilus rhododendri]